MSSSVTVAPPPARTRSTRRKPSVENASSLTSGLAAAERMFMGRAMKRATVSGASIASRLGISSPKTRDR